jgi:hypothetical protein
MGSGFNVTRSIQAKSRTASNATASLSVLFNGPGFNVTRRIRGKSATASRATAHDSGRTPLSVKVPISSSAKANMTALIESFLIQRGMRAKVGTASNAWATMDTRHTTIAEAGVVTVTVTVNVPSVDKGEDIFYPQIRILSVQS